MTQSISCTAFSTVGEYPTSTWPAPDLTLPVERRFGVLDAVQDYVDGVLALGWVRPNGRAPPCRCGSGSGPATSQAHYERADAVIAVPGHRANRAWALRELVVLHELAHHLADDSADRAEPPHGGEFVDRLLILVDGLLGPEAALLLRITMLESGVAVA